MNQITERVFIGSQADAITEALRENRITAVVTLMTSGDPLPQRVHLLRILQVDGEPIEAKTLDRFLQFMRAALTHPHGRVLIHCGAGVSRSAAFAVAWLMANGFDWESAEALVRSQRPQCQPHPALKQAVLEYFGGRR